VTTATLLKPADVAQAQLDAYNVQDLDRFCAFYAPHVVVAELNGEVTLRGRDAFRARYAEIFAQNPQNRAELVGRMVIGNRVIDHERVTRKAGETFDVAAIYTIADGLIVRVDFVK
jgi:uncharacterized protein (TIGR02246 family)